MMMLSRVDDYDAEADEVVVGNAHHFQLNDNIKIIIISKLPNLHNFLVYNMHSICVHWGFRVVHGRNFKILSHKRAVILMVRHER